jgi:D-amino-acid dehydrogenase
LANIAIVGAGVIGIASAAFLQRDGHSVTVYDPLPPGEGCSFGNAGSIGPGSVVPLSTPGIVRQAASWITDPNSPIWIDWRYLPRALPWLAKFIAAGASPRIDDIAKALRLLHADSFKHYRLFWASTAARSFMSPGSSTFMKAMQPLPRILSVGGSEMRLASVRKS